MKFIYICRLSMNCMPFIRHHQPLLEATRGFFIDAYQISSRLFSAFFLKMQFCRLLNWTTARQHVMTHNFHKLCFKSQATCSFWNLTSKRQCTTKRQKKNTFQKRHVFLYIIIKQNTKEAKASLSSLLFFFFPPQAQHWVSTTVPFAGFAFGWASADTEAETDSNKRLRKWKTTEMWWWRQGRCLGNPPTWKLGPARTCLLRTTPSTLLSLDSAAFYPLLLTHLTRFTFPGF